MPGTGAPALGLEDLAISPLEFFAEECANEEDAARRLEAYQRIRCGGGCWVSLLSLGGWVGHRQGEGASSDLFGWGLRLWVYMYDLR